MYGKQKHLGAKKWRGKKTATKGAI